MTRIEFVPEIQQDFDRILSHLLESGVSDASDRFGAIIQAIDALGHNPLIGRPSLRGNRELFIGRRTRGYVALYRYIESIEPVFVLAIRAQKEAGYDRT